MSNGLDEHLKWRVYRQEPSLRYFLVAAFYADETAYSYVRQHAVDGDLVVVEGDISSGRIVPGSVVYNTACSCYRVSCKACSARLGLS